MISMRKVASTLMVIVGLCGCGQRAEPGSASSQPSAGAAQKLRPFKIGIYTWIGYGPFYIAKEKGFFAQEGLDVDIQKIENDGTRRSALISHDLDGAIELVDQFANAAPRMSSSCTWRRRRPPSR